MILLISLICNLLDIDQIKQENSDIEVVEEKILDLKEIQDKLCHWGRVKLTHNDR